MRTYLLKINIKIFFIEKINKKKTLFRDIKNINNYI